MMTAPAVSVCVQAYQQAPFIRECLDSILAQKTDFHFEVIIGDDDSTDGTREICQQYAGEKPGMIRLFLRNEQQKIFVDGRKTGRFNFIENMRAARGKYISLLDGDDYWISPQKLQRQYDLMESDPGCSLSFHKTLQCIDHDLPALRIPPVSDQDRVYSIAELMRYVDFFSVHSSNCMFRRDSLEPVPAWFYEVPFLDVPLFIHTGAPGRVRYLNEAMSVYRIHRNGMWLSGKEPDNFIRQWKMFTILARETRGELQSAMLERRERLGRQLIRYYRRHLWEDHRWMKKELEGSAFTGDEELHRLLERAPGPTEYIFNVGAYSKKICKSILRK